jgi:hypothetical protein
VRRKRRYPQMAQMRADENPKRTTTKNTKMVEGGA